MPRNVIIAIGVIFFGIIAFDMMGIIVRLLGDTYPILQIAAMRNFFGMIPALILLAHACLLYTSPSPRDCRLSRMPSSA